jgi:radical SAM superfamily enzyme YgiQ (UPF0313 family)
MNQLSRKIAFCYFESRNVDYVPMDLGYITAILKDKKHCNYDINIIPLTYINRKDIEKEIEDINKDCEKILGFNPDAVFLFLENILWSKVFSLGRAKKIAKEIRSKNKNIFIGIQSYKIQSDQTAFLFDNDLADSVIIGDPESVLINLDDILNRTDINGVNYKGKSVKKVEKKKIIQNFSNDECELDKIPSPYLDNVFDSFLAKKQKELDNKFRAFLISSRGCSFGCYYCFRSVKFEKVTLFSAKRFFDEMEYLVNNFKINRFFVLDDAFLYSKERLSDFADEFTSRKNKNKELEDIKISLMARPESIDEDVVKLLSKLHVEKVQIGLQTVKKDIQHYMNRKVDVEHFEKISSYFRDNKIMLHLDVVLGLPGDSIENFKNTINYAVSLKPISMQVKQFYLNPNTLFCVEKDKYEIKTESIERDFDVPYVISAKNLDESYYIEADNFMMETINNHPEIYWKFLSEKNNFLSKNFRPDHRQSNKGQKNISKK